MKRNRFASRTTLAFTVVLLVSHVQLFAQQGTWVAKAPMPTARFGAATASVNGIIYAIGGDVNWFGCGFTNVNEAYNPATDTWTTMAPMPTARVAYAAAVLNGIIYVVGGSEGCFPPNRVVEAYDPATNTWSTKAQFPDTGSGLGVTNSAVGVINGILYVAGGNTTVGASPFLATLYAYDPVADSWSAKASMPDVRMSEAGAVVNGAFYVIGGNDYVGIATSTFAYDPTLNTWSTKAPLSDPRGGLAALAVGNKIYAIGGTDAASGALAVATMESYDPATNTWTTLPPVPIALIFPASAEVNGTIYVMGGLLSQNTGVISGTVQAFTPVSTPPLVGDGSAITNLTAANISSGTAGINITGNAATANSASGLICTGCVGNTQLSINYAGSASQGGPATSALLAGLATQATNSLSLGGILATNFARLDIGNAFTGNQSVAGNLAVAGFTALGGGTPILKHLSLTVSPTFPALKAQACSSANFTFTGASDGDTIALGVPNSRMTGGGTLNYFAWIAAADTITIRACNIDSNAKQTTAGSGAIRVDVWKH
jgi:hypothetical protein